MLINYVHNNIFVICLNNFNLHETIIIRVFRRFCYVLDLCSPVSLVDFLKHSAGAQFEQLNTPSGTT